MDMEMLVNQFLDQFIIKEVLKVEIDFLMVDEFQDISFIQFEIFLKFFCIVCYFVWVGDFKQLIYGFRGVDLELM